MNKGQGRSKKSTQRLQWVPVFEDETIDAGTADGHDRALLMLPEYYVIVSKS